MSSADTKELITQAARNFIAEVPALANLKTVMELELRGGRDVQLFRVEFPGPKITKETLGDERIRLAVPRATFNKLAEDAKISGWRRAFETGEAKASGPPEILRLIQNVVLKQEERSSLRKARPGEHRRRR